MSKLLGDLFRSEVRGGLVALLAVVIVLPLGCLLIFLPLAIGSRIADPTMSTLVMSVPPVLFVLLLFGGGFGLLARTNHRRAALLDAIFNPLGLNGRQSLLTMRAYQGTIRGREARAYYRRGPVIEVTLSTPLPTRLSVDEADKGTTAVAGWLNRHPLALDDPAFDGLRVFALDEAWARSLLAQPQVPPLLRRLILSEGPFVLRQLQLSPGQFFLRLFRSKRLLSTDIDPAQVRQWVEDVAALADMAESLPAPQETAVATPLEQTLRAQRAGLPRKALVILIVALFVIPLCLALPIVLFLIAR